MSAPHPTARAGIVFVGLVVAFAAAWVAVEVRQRLTQGPAAQASSGMDAAGDLMLGVAVFGLLALVPVGLGLFWLRSVAWFWPLLTGSALLFGWPKETVATPAVVAMPTDPSSIGSAGD